MTKLIARLDYNTFIRLKYPCYYRHVNEKNMMTQLLSIFNTSLE